MIPAYNEEDCVDELYSRLVELFTLEKAYEFEVIIIENGSIDSTWQKLQKINKVDSRFKVVKLSRNFRMDGGLTAGLDFVQGDACVLMTSDLQDPPEFISKFLREWEQGWENIYAIVSKRSGISFMRRLNSRAFYVIASFMTDGLIPRNASDFRLVDKKVYKAIRDMQERNRFVRGLFAWSGFKSLGIPINRPPRFGGISNAPNRKVLDLALKGIFAHSLKPLRFIAILGLIMFIFTIFVLLPLSILWHSQGVPFAGFGSILGTILLLNSILFLILGIIGEYLGLIYEEVKQRPNYIVSELLGLQPTQHE